MRKYRYGELSSKGSWFKIKNIVYFTLAWNACGFCVYQWWKWRKTTTDSDWAQLTSTQKYMSLMSKPSDELTVIKMRGLTVGEKNETTAAAFMQPLDIPPPPPSKTVESS